MKNPVSEYNKKDYKRNSMITLWPSTQKVMGLILHSAEKKIFFRRYFSNMLNLENYDFLHIEVRHVIIVAIIVRSQILSKLKILQRC